MALDQVLNEERWGRLDEEKKELKDRFSQEIRELCGEQAKQDSYRNSHLCLGVWMDVIRDRRSLGFSPLYLEYASRALEPVNSSSAKRFLFRTQVQERVRNDEEFNPTEKAQLSEEAAGLYTLNSPESRLTYWGILCLLGHKEHASNLLHHWQKAHLVDSLNLSEFMTDIQSSKLYPEKYKKQTQNCYLAMKNSLASK
jgi:hypothetical protein